MHLDGINIQFETFFCKKMIFLSFISNKYFTFASEIKKIKGYG